MKPIVGVRDLALATTVVIAFSRFVDGPLAWLMAALLLLATALGALQIIGSVDPAGSTSGVPIESLLPPALAAVGGAGALRIVPIGLLLIPALAIVAWFIERVVTTEARLARAATPPSRPDRTAGLVNGLVGAFGAFIGHPALAPRA